MGKIKLSIFWIALVMVSKAWTVDPAAVQPGSKKATQAPASHAAPRSAAGGESPAGARLFGPDFAPQLKIKPGYHPFVVHSLKEGKLRGQPMRGSPQNPLSSATPARDIGFFKKGGKLYMAGESKRKDTQNEIRKEVGRCGKNKKYAFCAMDLTKIALPPPFSAGRNLEKMTVSLDLGKVDYLRSVISIMNNEISRIDDIIQTLREEFLESPWGQTRGQTEGNRLIAIQQDKKEEIEKRKAGKCSDLGRTQKKIIKTLRDAKQHRIKRLIMKVYANSRGLTGALLKELFSGRSDYQSLTIEGGRSLLKESSFQPFLPPAWEKLCPHEKLEEIYLLTQVDPKDLKMVSTYAGNIKKMHLRGKISPPHLECLAVNFPHLETLCLQENCWLPFLGLSLYALTPLSEVRIEILKRLAQCIEEADEFVNEHRLIESDNGPILYALGENGPTHLRRVEKLVSEGERVVFPPDAMGALHSITTLLQEYSALSKPFEKTLGPKYKGLVAHLKSFLSAAENIIKFGSKQCGGQSTAKDFMKLHDVKGPRGLFPKESLTKVSAYFPALKNLEIVSGLNVIKPLQSLPLLSRVESIHFLQSNMRDHVEADFSFLEGLDKCDFSSLKELCFSYVNLWRFTLQLPLKAPRLKVLRLWDCEGFIVSLDLPRLFREMPGLTDLHLNRCFRRDLEEGAEAEGKISFPPDKPLRALSLKMNHIHDEDLESILGAQKFCDELESLDLSCNDITGEGICVLIDKRFPKLKELNLEGNRRIGLAGFNVLINGKDRFPELKYLGLAKTTAGRRSTKGYEEKFRIAFPKAILKF